MGLQDDLVVGVSNASFTLVYAGATPGWKIINASNI